MISFGKPMRQRYGINNKIQKVRSKTSFQKGYKKEKLL